MNLEDAVAKIESLERYKKPCEDSFDYLNNRLQYLDDSENDDVVRLQINLNSTSFYHHGFYEFVSMLSDFAKSEPPTAKNYGKNAQVWLQSEKKMYPCLYLMLGAQLTALALNVADLPTLSTAAFMAGAISSVTSLYYQYKRTNADREKDTVEYKKALGEYYAKELFFIKPTIECFNSSLDKYTQQLKEIKNDFGKFVAQDKLINITDNYIEVQNFKNYSEEIISVIKASKPCPVPTWGAISPEILAAEIKLTIEQAEKTRAIFKKSILDTQK